ncbi:MAG: hypothetical protein ABI559_03425 [Chloroflexota bacterium]
MSPSHAGYIYIPQTSDCGDGGYTNQSIDIYAFDYGYQFDGWDGDCAEQGNPATVLVDHNITCTAHFSEIPTPPPCYGVFITIEPDIGGYSYIPQTGTWSDGYADQTIDIYAYPNDGYQFDSWDADGPCAGQGNPASVYVSDAVCCAANFSEVVTGNPITNAYPHANRGSDCHANALSPTNDSTISHANGHTRRSVAVRRHRPPHPHARPPPALAITPRSN